MSPTRKSSFLKAIAGDDGALALEKASTCGPDIEWAILPRAIMAWVDAVGSVNWDEGLPGAEDINLTLKKSEGLYLGSIDIGSEVYSFEGASLAHVAGSIAVALGAEMEAPPAFKSPTLAKLGKNIDLLIKSRTLRKIQKRPNHGGAQGPGPAAAPIPPVAAIAPVAVETAKPDQGVSGTKTATSAKANAKPAIEGGVKAKPQLPGLPKKPSLKTLKVTKSEASIACPTCGELQFAENKYSGCLCFASLAKSTKTIDHGSYFTLEFGQDWDVDAIFVLLETLGK